MAVHGQEKNAGTCENLLGGHSGIALYHLPRRSRAATPPRRQSPMPRLDRSPTNAVKSAFSMRLTQKTAPSRPETENHMLYSIRGRPQMAGAVNFRALGFTQRPEYAI